MVDWKRRKRYLSCDTRKSHDSTEVAKINFFPRKYDSHAHAFTNPLYYVYTAYSIFFILILLEYSNYHGLAVY